MTKDNPLNLPISPLPWVNINTQIADNNFFSISELCLVTGLPDAHLAGDDTEAKLLLERAKQ